MLISSNKIIFVNRLTALLILIIAISVSFAWFTPLRQVLPEAEYLRSMAIESAILFIGISSILFTLQNEKNWLRPFVAASCFVAGLINFSDYWIASEIAAIQSAQLSASASSHMAIGSAGNFVLTGICILLFEQCQKEKNFKWGLAYYTAIFLITLISLAGLLENFIRFPSGTIQFGGKMAPLTSLCFIATASLLFINQKVGIKPITYHLSILSRIIFGYTLSTLLMLIIGYIFISHSNSVEHYIVNTVYNDHELSSETAQELKLLAHQANTILLIAMLGILAFNIVSLFFIGAGLKHQLDNIQSVIKRLSRGELEIEIPYAELNNEIGEMARTLQSYANSLKSNLFAEEKFKSLIEHLPLGIVVSNKRGKIILTNNLSENIFGYSREEFSELTIEHLLPNNQMGQHKNLRHSYFDNPTPRNMGKGQELFAQRKDLSLFPVEIGLMPVNLSDEILVIATVADISDRKQRESKLSHQRELLEITTKATQVGLWEFHTKSGRLNWSDSMFTIYGRNPDLFQNTYDDWKQTVHPDDIQAAEQVFLQFMTEKNQFNTKFRIVKPDGSIAHILAKARFYQNSDGDEIILGSNIDITSEENLSKKIHEIENLRSSIVEYSDDAIYSKTPFGLVTSWNKGAEKIFGYTEAEALGKQITDLIFPPNKKQEIEDLQADVRDGKTISHYETICIHKDGHLLDVSISLSPIKDSKGNVVGISSIKRDISTAKAAERLLAQRQKSLEKLNSALEKSNQDLEAFAHVASHDLKSPLRGIAQLIGWLEQDITDNRTEDIHSNIQSVRKRVLRMEKLLDDLLLFYRVEQNYGEITTIHLTEFIQDIFEMNNSMKGMELVIEGALPDINTFPTPLEMVIRNLISNAIKHHDKTTGKLTISCASKDDQWWEFRVADDGPGIPEKYHTRVFKMFQTLKPRDQVEGSGIGLTLIQKIVQGFGGNIRIDSKERGTAFIFTWPKNHVLIKEENHANQ